MGSLVNNPLNYQNNAGIFQNTELKILSAAIERTWNYFSDQSERWTDRWMHNIYTKIFIKYLLMKMREKAIS